MFKSSKNKLKDDARRVLVIDDEAMATHMIKLNLESTGDYIVETLNESERSIDVAKEFAPDIILLDIVMPGMDGGEVALQLRNRTATKNIPIIFVSAMVSSDESKKGFYQSGGEYYLAKPVDKITLIGAIEVILAKSASN